MSQVIDIHLGEHGEVIANIPVRVHAKAVYSNFSLCPANDINFGSMLINSRKQSTFNILNKGEFEFKFSITKFATAEQQKMRVMSMAAVAAKNRVRSREKMSSAKSSSGGKSVGGKKIDGPMR